MNSSFSISRRQLLGGATLASLSGTLFSQALNKKEVANPKIHLKPGVTLLFQGDSITDAGRQNRKSPNPNEQASMGNGYACMAAAGILNSSADLKLSIFNRGISGNKVHQLDARWQSDCLAHKPDILSILIGVNDIWHGFQGKYDGTVDRYEEDYLALVARTRKALPDIQLVICEPFVLKCGAVSSKWFPEFDRYREAARRVADSHAATFVPFQSMFDQASSFAPPQHWARDGVHPTAYGSALMADYWLQAVRG
jgi:lysophospholipase L1-like esterase